MNEPVCTAFVRVSVPDFDHPGHTVCVDVSAAEALDIQRGWETIEKLQRWDRWYQRVAREARDAGHPDAWLEAAMRWVGL